MTEKTLPTPLYVFVDPKGKKAEAADMVRVLHAMTPDYNIAIVISTDLPLAHVVTFAQDHGIMHMITGVSLAKPTPVIEPRAGSKLSLDYYQNATCTTLDGNVMSIRPENILSIDQNFDQVITASDANCHAVSLINCDFNKVIARSIAQTMPPRHHALGK